MSSVSLQLSQKFSKYQQDEKDFQQSQISNKVSRLNVLTALAFELHHAGLIGLLVRVSSIVDWSVSILDNDKSLPGLGTIILWICLLLWFIVSHSMYYGDSGWNIKVAKGWKDFLTNKSQLQRLKKERKDREQFFQFYELYQTDAHFREQYDNAMLESSVQNAKDFMKRLENKANDQSLS